MSPGIRPRWSADVPLPSPLRYPGGKSRAARQLLAYAPEHRAYREPFAGGAALFLRKLKVAENWLNDLHPGLYAFYLTLRDNFEAFARLCREQRGDRRTLFNYWVSRKDLMQAAGDEALLERAVQFYYINRTVWGGRVVYDPSRESRLYFSNPQGWDNLEKKLGLLKQVSEKLQGVRVTCVSFEECLADADEETFIYCDPPYIRDTNCHPTDKLYDKSFGEESHHRLAQLLRETQAKVMLSYDDCPQARALYDAPGPPSVASAKEGWHFEHLSWKYCGRYAMTKEAKANGVKEQKVLGNELLLLNYEAPTAPEASAKLLPKRTQELIAAVTTAFLQTHGGHSTDDVVICDEFNEVFVTAAQQIVPDAKAAELNWMLFGLRKAAKLGRVTTTRIRLRDQEEFAHAAEIAARLMEDNCAMTLDRVLCDPVLREQFDSFAQAIAPGYTPYHYRKAALNLRKARRLRPELVKRIMPRGKQPNIIDAAMVTADPTLVPSLPGIYMLYDRTGCLYLGESENLRLRVRKHLDHSDNKSLARYFWAQHKKLVKVEVIPFERGNLAAIKANRKALEADLIKSRKPKFNLQLVG